MAVKLLKAHWALTHPDARHSGTWQLGSPRSVGALTRGLWWGASDKAPPGSAIARAVALRASNADTLPADPIVCALVALLDGSLHHTTGDHVRAWAARDHRLALDAVLALPDAQRELGAIGIAREVGWLDVAWALRRSHADHRAGDRRPDVGAAWERVPADLRWVWAIAFPDMPAWADEVVDAWRTAGAVPTDGHALLASLADPARVRWLVDRVGVTAAAPYAMDLVLHLDDPGPVLLDLAPPGAIPKPVLTALTARRTPAAAAGLARALAQPKLHKTAAKALSKMPALALPALAADGGARALALRATLARAHPDVAPAATGGPVPALLAPNGTTADLPRRSLAPVDGAGGVAWGTGERERARAVRTTIRGRFRSAAEHAAWVSWRVRTHAAEARGQAPPTRLAVARSAGVELDSEAWDRDWSPRGGDLAALPRDEARAAFDTHRYGGHKKHPLDPIVAHLEGGAGPGLIALARATRSEDAHRWLDRVHHPGMVAGWIAYALASAKRRSRFLDWCARFPDSAACGLLPVAFGEPGKARELAREAVRALAEHHRHTLQLAAEVSGDDVWPALERWLAGESGDAGTCPDWLDPEAGPPLHHDGRPLSPAARLRLVELLAGLPPERRSSRIDPVVAALDPAEAGAWAAWLLDAWVRAGADHAARWVPAAAVQLGGDAVAGPLAAHVLAWPAARRTRLADLGVTVLGFGDSPAFLGGLLTLVERGTPTLAARASSRLDGLLPALGVTRDALRELTIPALPFPRSWSLGRRTLTADLHTDLTVGLAVGGRRVKQVPRRGKTDDPALLARARADVKALRHELARVRRTVAGVVDHGWLARRRWTAADLARWLAHPVLGPAARGLLWTDGATAGPPDAGWTQAWPVHPLEADAPILAAMVGLEPVTPQRDRTVHRPDRTSYRLRLARRLTVSRAAVLRTKRRGWTLRVVDDVHDAVLVAPALPVPDTDLWFVAEIYPGVDVADRSDTRAQDVWGLTVVRPHPDGKMSGVADAVDAVQASEALRRLVADLA